MSVAPMKLLDAALTLCTLMCLQAGQKTKVIHALRSDDFAHPSAHKTRPRLVNHVAFCRRDGKYYCVVVDGDCSAVPDDTTEVDLRDPVEADAIADSIRRSLC